MNVFFLAFVTGLTTGGLSCLAVQGGLLASSIAHEVEQSVQSQPAQPARRRKQAPRRPARPTTAQAGAGQPRAARPIVLFLSAKLIAYTILGFFLGLLGSALQLTPALRAIMLAAIGVFMVGTALRMFNVHPVFRYFALEPPSSFTRYIRRKSRGQASALTPLFLGALTVLIPCGVTQAMMAAAIAAGSAITGATLMFAFILGTSPVFFAVAYLATRLGSRLERNFTRYVAAVVLVLGLISIDGGLTLAGWPYSITNLRMAAAAGNLPPEQAAGQPAAAPGAEQADVALAAPASAVPDSAGPGQTPARTSTAASTATDLGNLVGPADADGGRLTITVRANGYFPKVTRSKANQPLKLSLVTNKTYSCARDFVIPALGVEKVLPATGTVVVDVPAQPAGAKLFYSCSMGMYSGVIVFEG